MKREDLIAKGWSEEQITEYLNMYHSVQKLEKEVEQAKAKETETKVLADGLQKQLNDINEANMSEQEKVEAMRKETERNLAESRKVYNKAKVKEVLAGYDVEDELINSLVTDDESVSLTSANMLKTRLDTIIANTTKRVQDNIASKDVKPTASNIPTEDEGMTKDKFLRLPMSEQVKFKRENPEKAEEFLN